MVFLSSMGLVILMGFYGSWHCGAMCGPITMNFKKSSEFWLYQLSRLMSYSLMTVFIYQFSQVFLKSNLTALRVGASVLMGLTLIYMGFLNWHQGKPTPNWMLKITQRIPLKIQKKIFANPMLLGLWTALFPCGWLYSFLLLTPQMKNLGQALVLILLFWSTALPIMMSFRGIVLKLIQESPRRYQRTASIVLIFAGLLSIFGQWSYSLSELLNR